MESLAGAAGLTIALAVVGGYLLGSIPFGLIAARLGGAGDIRQIGSGNIGATNVLRTGRRDLAAFTLIGDMGKGALAILIARWLVPAAPDIGAVAGGAAFLGHLFPVWLKFRGGKGVATFFGVLLAAAWPVGLLSGLTWIVIAVIARYSSLAALTAAGLAPVFALYTHKSWTVFWLTVFMAALIFLRHRANMGRLITGAEPRIGEKKDEPAA
ncbi:MAG TPA: glycerol-3-phosphate 1-O-acyltransferase PlsY [Caulobacteraceae bacterium]